MTLTDDDTWLLCAQVCILCILCTSLAAGPVAALGSAQNGTATPTATAAETTTDRPETATTPTTTATATATASPPPTATATATAAPTGDSGDGDLAGDGSQFTLQELRRTGRVASEAAPPSVRLLGGTGAVAVRYDPAAPFSGSNEFLKPKTTLNTDDIQLYSTRFGENVEAKDYTLHVAYYNVGTKEVAAGNGSTVERTVPVNVSHQRVSVTMDAGYDVTNVSLRPHYGTPVEMTMWLTTASGTTLDGVRWAGLKHRSDPAGQSVPIEDKGDLWRYVMINAFGVGAIALLGAFWAGDKVLRKIGRGPNLGLGTYGVVGVLAAGAIGTTAYLATNTILSNLPIVWGVLLGLIGFVGYLEVGGPPERSFLFEQDDLTDATSPSGDDVQDSVKQFVEHVGGIRRDDGTIGLPADGIRPAIARFFANPATLEEIDLTTRVQVGGDFDEKFIADPDAGDVLVHTPAHLVWDPTLIEAPDETLEPDERRGLLERINWTFVVGSVGALAGGWYIGQQFLQMPMLGLVPGLLAVAIMGHTAVDGNARFEPAPVHLRSAKATVLGLGREYSDAKTYEEAEKERFRAEAETATELRRRERDRSKTISQRIAEKTVGVDFDAPGAGGAPGEGAAPHPENEQNRRQSSREEGPGVGIPGDKEDSDDSDDDSSGSSGGGWRNA